MRERHLTQPLTPKRRRSRLPDATRMSIWSSSIAPAESRDLNAEGSHSTAPVSGTRNPSAKRGTGVSSSQGRCQSAGRSFRKCSAKSIASPDLKSHMTCALLIESMHSVWGIGWNPASSGPDTVTHTFPKSDERGISLPADGTQRISSRMTIGRHVCESVKRVCMLKSDSSGLGRSGERDLMHPGKSAGFAFGSSSGSTYGCSASIGSGSDQRSHVEAASGTLQASKASEPAPSCVVCVTPRTGMDPSHSVLSIFFGGSTSSRRDTCTRSNCRASREGIITCHQNDYVDYHPPLENHHPHRCDRTIHALRTCQKRAEAHHVFTCQDKHRHSHRFPFVEHNAGKSRNT